MERQDLEGDVPAQRFLHRLIDHAHAPTPDLVSLMNELSLSESMPRIGTGNWRRIISNPSATSSCSRASSGTASLHPE
jgi:hypothetical protein